MAVKRLLPATALFKLSTFGSAFCWKERKINIRGKIHVVLYVTNQPFPVWSCRYNVKFVINWSFEWNDSVWLEVLVKECLQKQSLMSNKHPVGLVLLRTTKASYIKNNALQSLSNLYHKLLQAPCLRKAIKKSETKKS